MISLFGYIFRRSWLALLLSILAGIISGLSGVLLLAAINNALDHRIPAGLWLVFSMLCLSLVGGRFVSEYILTLLGQNAIRELRIGLSKKVTEISLIKLQQLGPGNILANLTEDISEISQAFARIPATCVNVAVIAGCIAYLGWISLELLWLVLLALVIGAISFQAIQHWAYGYLKTARDHEDQVYGHFRSMTDGIKELKLHQGRRQAFLSECVETAVNDCRRNQLKAMLLYAVAVNWGNGLFYLVIGSILFLVPLWQEVATEIARGYCLVILYMTWPLPQLLDSLSSLSKAGVAVKKIQRLNDNLAATFIDSKSSICRSERKNTPVLELSDIRYSYYGEENRFGFTLGPVNLTLHPGELVFLIGGNGCGKSTLALLLVGLYPPDGGTIRLDGDAITEDNIEYYRQHFSAIFFDFFLFESLLGFDKLEIDNQVQEYLKLLDLDHKVSIEGGRFSTLSLSQGQRKRLALLVAYLEDRPFYVFDEWAADQDPAFKKIFYEEILISLKSRGKTVVVITHDDAYFSMADRCLKLQDGKLFEIPPPKASYSRVKTKDFAAPVTALAEVGHEA
jgi:putative ATP-binding cassette transporter